MILAMAHNERTCTLLTALGFEVSVLVLGPKMQATTDIVLKPGGCSTLHATRTALQGILSASPAQLGDSSNCTGFSTHPLPVSTT